MSIGADFFCGVREDMTLRCWGKRLILNGMPAKTEEILLISAGAKQICAVLVSNTLLYCWGAKHGAPHDLDVAL